MPSKPHSSSFWCLFYTLDQAPADDIMTWVSVHVGFLPYNCVPGSNGGIVRGISPRLVPACWIRLRRNKEGMRAKNR